WVPGDRSAERAMHQRYAHLHVMGEWFWDDDCYDQMLEADPLAALPWMFGSTERLMLRNPGMPREDATAVARAEHARRSIELGCTPWRSDGFLESQIAIWKADRAERRATWRTVRAHERAQV